MLHHDRVQGYAAMHGVARSQPRECRQERLHAEMDLGGAEERR